MEILLFWHNRYRNNISIPVFFIWGIWKWRNIILFDGVEHHFAGALSYIVQVLLDAVPKMNRLKIHALYAPKMSHLSPIRYFDGASKEGNVGIGGLVFIDKNVYYELSLGGGRGSNTRAELLALWNILHFARSKQLSSLQIFGDSNVIIGWATGKSFLNVSSLHHWKQCITMLLDHFQDISFQHIS